MLIIHSPLPGKDRKARSVDKSFLSLNVSVLLFTFFLYRLFIAF